MKKHLFVGLLLFPFLLTADQENSNPFEGILTEQEVQLFGLDSLQSTQQERFGDWLKGKLSPKTKKTEAKLLFKETLQTINSGDCTISLLDGSLWEFPSSEKETLRKWYPGQRVFAFKGVGGDYPYQLLNEHNQEKIPVMYLKGAAVDFPKQTPEFSLLEPVENKQIIAVDLKNNAFLLEDQSQWEIIPENKQALEGANLPLSIQFQKSKRRYYPYTFQSANKELSFAATPKLRKQNAQTAESAKPIRRISECVNFGEYVILDDNSQWIISGTDQEVSFTWDTGDLIETKKSERSDFPYLLMNRTSQTFALAAPSSDEVIAKKARLKNKPKATTPKSVYVDTVSRNGRYLHLSNGITYLVSPIDRGLADRWLPQHRVRIDDSQENGGQFSIVIENLNRQESVRAKKV